MGKNIKYGRGEGNIKGVGKNITCNNGKWKEKSFNFKAVGKNIKWGRGRGTLKIQGRK